MGSVPDPLSTARPCAAVSKIRSNGGRFQYCRLAKGAPEREERWMTGMSAAHADRSRPAAPDRRAAARRSRRAERARARRRRARCVARSVQPGRSMTASGIRPAIVSPAAPAMEAGEAIRAHDPDEPHARTARDEVARESTVNVAPISSSNPVTSMRGRRATTRAAARRAAIGGKSLGVFKRIAGRHHPPDAVEPQPFQRKQADMPVPRMRRIERAAVEADPQAGRMGRQRGPLRLAFSRIEPARPRARGI